MLFKAWDKFGTRRKRSWIIEPKKSRNALAGINPKLKQIAYHRLAILREYHLRLSWPGRCKTKREVMERFLLDFNSGVLSPDEATKFISHVGRATVYNWDKRHRHGGILALVPRYTTKSLAGRTIFWPLKHPFEIKLSGRPVRNGKVNFRARLKRHWKHHPLEGPISLGIFYSMPIPRGTKMQRRMKMLKHRISHIGKPNLDVLNAFVVDCLMGIVFKSHCQIINFHSEKRYAWWPEIKVLIRQLKG